MKFRTRSRSFALLHPHQERSRPSPPHLTARLSRACHAGPATAGWVEVLGLGNLDLRLDLRLQEHRVSPLFATSPETRQPRPYESATNAKTTYGG